GDLETVRAHPLLDGGDRRLDHLDAGPALGVALDELPASVRVVGALEHFLDGAGVGAPSLAVAPVLVGELPGLQRVLGAPLEALELLGTGDVHPELDDDHPLGRQRALEARDLVVGPGPLLLGGKAFHALDENAAVPR